MEESSDKYQLWPYDDNRSEDYNCHVYCFLLLLWICSYIYVCMYIFMFFCVYICKYTHGKGFFFSLALFLLHNDFMSYLSIQQIWKTQQWPQNWERSVFIPIPKKDNVKECSNYCTIAFLSRASEVMLKILQARLHNTWTVNFLMFKLVLEKAEEPEIILPTSTGSSKKAREFQKNIYYCFIDYAKAFDCGDHNKLKYALREGNTRPPDLPLEKFVCRSGSNS